MNKIGELIPGPNESLLHNGAACARLAWGSYLGNGDGEPIEPWSSVRWFSNANAEGLVGWGDELKVAFISIAGTNDGLDALNDMDCAKVPLKIEGTGATIHVHKGFLHHARTVMNAVQLLRVCTNLRRKSLYVIGHSLGGAAAQILPLLWQSLVPTQIHTFGAPRWCASENALDYPYDVIHWRRPEDIVPDVPLHLTWMRCLSKASGFSHVRGQRCWLTESRADTETDHFARRVKRAWRYRAATLRGLCASWRHGWMPVHTTLRIIAELNKQAADDHRIDEYFRLADKHRLARSSVT